MASLDPPMAVVWPEWCYENNGKERDHHESVMNNNNKEAKNKNVNFISKGKETTISRVLKTSQLEISSSADSSEERSVIGVHVGVSTNANGSGGGSGSSSVGTKDDTNHVSPSERGTTDVRNGPPPPPSSPKSFTTNPVLTTSYSKTTTSNHTGNQFAGFTSTTLTPHVPPTATTITTTHSPYDRISPAALNQVESLATRNCSDLIRSLAAKYNNKTCTNSGGSCSPNDYLNNFTNGFSRSLLPGICLFKGQPATSTQLNSTYVTSAVKVAQSDQKTETPVTPIAARVSLGIPPPGAHSMFPSNGIPGTHGFPLVDVPSTHLLLNMVRNASVVQHSQLETYLRGTVKRAPEGPSSPLDLSSSVATKRQRTENKSFGIKNPCPEGEKKKAVSPPTVPTSAKPLSIHSLGSQPHHTERVPSGGPCGDRECPSLEGVLRWTVEDVCDFVRSVDLCAEYVEAFREHRIDGSSLPLLTEDHLTTSIHMKLGPALKLRSVLARRLGSCGFCLHCAHCHSPPPPPTAAERRPTSAASGQ